MKPKLKIIVTDNEDNTLIELHPTDKIDILQLKRSLESSMCTEKDLILYDSLTNREKLIVSLIADGMSNKDIAHDLGISVKTVMAHRDNLGNKLKLNRSDLVHFALRLGLLESKKAA